MNKNENFGLPKVDSHTAKIINYIFRRLRGAVPALKYAADSADALDSIRAEYTYALMRHKISDVDIINRAIELVVDAGEDFLPPPGRFIKYCKKSQEEAYVRLTELYRERCISEEKLKLKSRLEAERIYKSQGGQVPNINLSCYLHSRLYTSSPYVEPEVEEYIGRLKKIMGSSLVCRIEDIIGANLLLKEKIGEQRVWSIHSLAASEVADMEYDFRKEMELANGEQKTKPV